MKTLYLECNMGAAGDMLMAALLELHDNPKDFLDRLNKVGIPDVEIIAEPSNKCGISGTHISVRICKGVASNALTGDHALTEGNDSHSHHGTGVARYAPTGDHAPAGALPSTIHHLNLSPTIKTKIQSVYKILAEAESQVHGVPVDKIHFHEIGEMDAVADITGVCMLIEELAPELILASPVNTGSGHVHCAHGILPVPAPATARILQNIPAYSDGTDGELCTPTGAALLKYFVKDFCKMPTLTVSKLGYGFGKKDFEKANCVRAYLGNSNEEVVELACNLDDMTPEAVAFAQQLLLEEGALDVYTVPAGMKKGRPGLIFNCMCKLEMKEKMLSLIFKHTTTIGIREYICRRYTLQREEREVQTEFGPVRVKTSSGFGVTKSKPEYEDVVNIILKNV